jgi:hypothetical protein
MTLQEIRQVASRGTTARKKHKRVKGRTEATTCRKNNEGVSF